MLRFLSRSTHRNFAFMPERSTRYFNLKLTIRNDIPISGTGYLTKIIYMNNIYSS